MNPDPTQPQNDMTEDENAAMLGFISTLSRQNMGMEAPQEATQEAESAPTAEQMPEPQNDLAPRTDALESQITGLKDEVTNEVKSIKEMIQDALTEDEKED